MANSVLCVKRGKWNLNHRRCAKVKWVIQMLGRDFVCGRCKKQVDRLVEPVEELCEQVENKRTKDLMEMMGLKETVFQMANANGVR